MLSYLGSFQRTKCRIKDQNVASVRARETVGSGKVLRQSNGQRLLWRAESLRVAEGVQGSSWPRCSGRKREWLLDSPMAGPQPVKCPFGDQHCEAALMLRPPALHMNHK